MAGAGVMPGGSRWVPRTISPPAASVRAAAEEPAQPGRSRRGTVEVSEMTQLVQHRPSWVAELDQDLDALLGEVSGPLAAWPWYRAVPAGNARWAPACEVFSKDGDVVVELDLPGVDPDKDVQVTVQDGVLCISGERHPRDREGEGYYRREWRQGAFTRGFTLPAGVTGEGITASYHNGVLQVVVPKAVPQTAGPRHIPVTGGQAKAVAAGEPAA
jgi:HSP20 family protein